MAMNIESLYIPEDKFQIVKEYLLGIADIDKQIDNNLSELQNDLRTNAAIRFQFHSNKGMELCRKLQIILDLIRSNQADLKVFCDSCLDVAQKL